jgi:hypothetical protein
MVYSPNQWGIGNKGYNPALGGGAGGGSSFMPKMLGSLMGGGGGAGGYSSGGAAAKPTLMSGGPMAMAIDGGASGSDSGAATADKSNETLDSTLMSKFNMAAKMADQQKRTLDIAYNNYSNANTAKWKMHFGDQYKASQESYQKTLADLADAWKPIYDWHKTTGNDFSPDYQDIAAKYGLNLW